MAEHVLVKRWLDELAGGAATPKDIERRLMADGCRLEYAMRSSGGIPWRASSCPVAQYLRRRAKAPVVVTMDRAIVVGVGEAPLPSVVAEYLRAFDQRRQ